MVTIIRVEHNKNRPYVLVARSTIEDNELDLRSKGFLIFLLSKPDDWRIRPEQIADELSVGRATIYRLLNKLIRRGYVHREIVPARKKDGTFASTVYYVVFEDKEARRDFIDKGRFLYERDKAAASQK